MKKIKLSLLAAFAASVMFSSTSFAMSEQEFFDKRSALIIKHSFRDNTFEALQNEQSFTPEHTRWRVDQYLYGQYPEYQSLYDAYTQGKTFHQIYDLPAEDLGPKWQKPAHLPSIPEGFFTDNLPGNAYTGWHKLVGDTLYVTYQGHLTDPYVASYSLKTRQWQGPYKAGHSTLSKGDRKIDSHGRPIIEVDSQGYVHIVFGGHGGEREDGLNPLSIDTPHAGGRMKHVVSEKPYDLSAFVEKDDITPFASYTKSYKMDNGDIYFFTRAGTHKSPWVYYKMKSGSQTFEAPVMLTWPTPHKDDPITVDTLYINPKKVSATTIDITALWHACNFRETHDKTTYNRLNAYYMKLDTTTDTLYNVKGEKLTLPLLIDASNEHTLAYDSQATKETVFGTAPVVLEDGKVGMSYLARGKGYREWRMALFENGKWRHSLPMPGTVNRTLTEANGTKIKEIIALQVLKAGKYGNSAAVTYRNAGGETVFAIAKKRASTNSKKQNWQVEKVHFKVAKAKMQLEAVNDDAGETVAVIVNVRKGVSQRLYLWHDGEFRENHQGV